MINLCLLKQDQEPQFDGTLQQMRDVHKFDSINSMD